MATTCTHTSWPEVRSGPPTPANVLQLTLLAAPLPQTYLRSPSHFPNGYRQTGFRPTGHHHAHDSISVAFGEAATGSRARAQTILNSQQEVQVVSAKTTKATKPATAAAEATVLLDRFGTQAKAAKRRVPQREIDAAVARVRAEQYANGHHAPDATEGPARHS